MSGRTPAQISDALVAVLKTIPGLHAHVMDGRQANPPVAIVGPPSMRWTGYCGPASEMTFPVTLVVRKDDKTIERLYDLLPAISVAIDTVEDASVVAATPGTWGSADDGYPAYTLTIEVAP